MAFKPGELTTTDLSPNANILGTQIADNTIQLRNLTDDTFRVVQTGSITFSALSIGDPGAGVYASGDSITTKAHGLGFAPAVLAYIVQSGEYYPTPYVSVSGSGAVARWATWSINVDSTSIYARLDVTVLHQAWVSDGTSFTVKYYLLQEKASIT